MAPRAALLVSFLLLAGHAAPSLAGKFLQYEPEPGAAGEPMNILVRPPHVRMETGTYAMVYDSNTEQTFVLDLQERTYYRMTRERADELAEQISAAQAQMQQVMEQAKAAMTEEQLAQLEQYMGQSGLGAMSGPTEFAFRRSGRDGQVLDIDCEWVEMLMNGEPMSELCIADSAELGLNQEEQQAVEKLSELLLAMGNRFSNASLERRPDGMPIAMNDFQRNERVRLTLVDERTLDAVLFDVPADFQPMSLFPGQ